MMDAVQVRLQKNCWFISMKINFHTIEFMSAEADMGCKFENRNIW